LLTGSGKIRGLLVGNPKEFKTTSSISVGTASMAVKPMSLLDDKIVIESISLEAPEITYETDLHKSNLKTILANVEEATGGQTDAAKPKDAKPAKKLQVNDFLIKGGRIHLSLTVMGGQSATVPLPEIHLTNLGSGPEGITPAELTKRVLGAITEETVKASADVIAKIGKGAMYIGSDAAKGATNAVEKAAKGIGDLFKKK
jgi:uncharacterized protein involved in outer membrane biogenesis